jgi:hypothetical protein
VLWQQTQGLQPNLGISIQDPSNWLLVGESDDKLNFLKDDVAVEIDIDDLDPSDTTLSDYSNERVDDLREDCKCFLNVEFLHSMYYVAVQYIFESALTVNNQKCCRRQLHVIWFLIRREGKFSR